MTAECEILVNDLRNVLYIPVAAVVEQRGEFLCWVQDGVKIEKRPLVLGETNDQFVEVKDGVADGEQVVLNPRTVVEEARGIREEVEKTDKAKKFGDRSKGGKPGPEGAGGPPSAGGPAEAGGPGAGAPGGGSPGAGGPAAGGRSGGGGGRSMDLMQYDKDKDGKVSKDEAPSQMANFFDRLDTDGDGFIDQAEIDELRKQFGSGGGRPGGGGPPQ
jgi:hypothetical protein